MVFPVWSHSNAFRHVCSDVGCTFLLFVVRLATDASVLASEGACQDSESLQGLRHCTSDRGMQRARRPFNASSIL